ncbi:hypothetical protein Tco_0465525 [Tanacetum coccineum]
MVGITICHWLNFLTITVTIPALRLHRLRHFTVESVDNPSAGPRLVIANSLVQRSFMKRLRISFSTWMAFGGNTRDLGSFEEETDEITTLHQSRRRKGYTGPGDGVTITYDGVISSKRRRQENQDGVRT